MRGELLFAAISGAIVALAAVSALEAIAPPPPTVLVDAPSSPIVNADWSQCVVHRGPPIDGAPPGKALRHWRNGGTA
jgi:hypothetical protein